MAPARARQIVCGAKNYKVGDKVPVALPGAVLPGDFKIKVGKLRGVESQGMLCSADELGLPKGEDGLLILSPEAQPGTPLGELFRATRFSIWRSRPTAPISSASTASHARSPPSPASRRASSHPKPKQSSPLTAPSQ
jgi:hypothetical protein